MAKMTIAQCREKEVERLAFMHSAEPTEEDFTQAKKLMASFYRLCGLCERNLYNGNDARTANTKWYHDDEEKESKWVKRLAKQFDDFAGLTLCYCGYMPSIGIENDHGFSEKIFRYFY